MKTSTYNAWWRELGAISRGMMFIEGSVATPVALDVVDPRRNARDASRHGRTRPNARRHAFSLYEDLLFLGGRPMTAGHNDDIDEPFPQTAAEVARGPHGKKARRAESNASRGLRQGLALLALAVAAAWSLGIGPSPFAATTPANLAEPAGVAVQSAAATTTSIPGIVDLPPVTVRAQPEDLAWRVADQVRRIDCIAC